MTVTQINARFTPCVLHADRQVPSAFLAARSIARSDLRNLGKTLALLHFDAILLRLGLGLLSVPLLGCAGLRVFGKFMVQGIFLVTYRVLRALALIVGVVGHCIFPRNAANYRQTRVCLRNALGCQTSGPSLVGLMRDALHFVNGRCMGADVGVCVAP